MQSSPELVAWGEARSLRRSSALVILLKKAGGAADMEVGVKRRSE